MSKLHFESLRAVPFAVAVALAGAGSPGGALTVDVSVSASHFVGRLGPELTLEVPPEEELIASFSASTDGVHDFPDVVTPASENGFEYKVLHIYTTPSASQMEIAGTAYAPADLQAYFGFVDGRFAQLMIGGRARYEPGDGPTACIATATTNDFILNVNIGPSPSGEPQTPPMFVYTIAETTSSFFADSLHVTLSIDSGPPMEFVLNPPLEDAIPCSAAKPAGGDGGLAEGAKPGDVLCASGATRLRDARVASSGGARGAPSEPVTVTTELGTLTLRAAESDRVLLAAAAGNSAALEAPPAGDSYRCAKVRRAPGAARFEPISGVRVPQPDGVRSDSYAVRKPTRLCVGSEPDDMLLCYAAKAKGSAARSRRGSEVWVAHALGVERLKVTREAELCLPAS